MRRPRRAKQRGDSIYVMRDGTGYKIGRSDNLVNRLATFRTGNSEIEFLAGVLDPRAETIEKRLHAYFDAARKDPNLEWFYATPEVDAWVNRFCAHHLTATLIEDINASHPSGVYPWEMQPDRGDENGQVSFDLGPLSYVAPIGKGTGQTSAVSEDWYTPARYVDAARAVFGGTIDLDPMSCVEANRTVDADRIYTAEVDGLKFAWHGNVFLNPPWGNGPNNAKVRAVRKALTEHQQGNTKSTILVLNANAITAGWFAPLLEACDAIAIPNHRVAHYGPGGKGGAPNSGTVFVYLGHDPERFAEVFSAFGTVLETMSSGGTELLDPNWNPDEETSNDT